MFSLSPKTLSSPLFLHKTVNQPQPKSRQQNALVYNPRYETERGFEFDTGETFFRHESATGRDLGVLAAALHKKSNGTLRVLDALCGCGVRSLRYLAEAKADFVLANDANEGYRSLISSNLSRVSSGLEEGKWEVRHLLANRLMAEKYVERDCFDFIDVDSFGSDSSFFRPAFDIVKLGGLLYLTSTDGHTSGGHRPSRSLASYGAFVRPVPYANEIGLRMLIGGAVREASVLGYHVLPLFSYYSYHGPVFRSLLQVTKGKLPEGHYRFISYCITCGNSQAISWVELGEIKCPCNSNVPGSLVVSGPLWTGPLHSTSYLTEMLNLAEQWGWTGSGNGMRNHLEKVLIRMVDESDPNLPIGYIHLTEIASRGKLNSPPLKTMMSTMQKEGYAASRSHIASDAIKTNCPMADCIRIMKELQPIRMPKSTLFLDLE